MVVVPLKQRVARAVAFVGVTLFGENDRCNGYGVVDVDWRMIVLVEIRIHLEGDGWIWEK